MGNRFFTKSQQVGEKSKILYTFRNCFRIIMWEFSTDSSVSDLYVLVDVFDRLFMYLPDCIQQTPPYGLEYIHVKQKSLSKMPF